MARRAARQHKPKPAKRTSRQHNERGSPKPSPWVLLQDAYQRLRAYLEPSEAVQRLTSMPIKKRYVNSNGEKILFAETIELSVGIDVATGADYLEIYDREYFHPSQDEPVEFYVPVASVERELERLYPIAVAPPPGPSKEPTPKKKRRETKSAPVKARRRGPKAKILPRLTAAMKDDIANQKLSLDELKAMPDKTLEDRYSAKRERIKAALLVVADELKK
jgi:hypothetical protein